MRMRQPASGELEIDDEDEEDGEARKKLGDLLSSAAAESRLPSKFWLD